MYKQNYTIISLCTEVLPSCLRPCVVMMRGAVGSQHILGYQSLITFWAGNFSKTYTCNFFPLQQHSHYQAQGPQYVGNHCRTCDKVFMSQKLQLALLVMKNSRKIRIQGTFDFYSQRLSHIIPPSSHGY